MYIVFGFNVFLFYRLYMLGGDITLYVIFYFILFYFFGVS